MTKSKLIAILLVVATIASGVYLVIAGNDFWFPEGHSTVAASMDFVFMFITWLSIFFFVLIVALMFWFAVRYRSAEHPQASSDVTHNTPLELTWTIIPLILVIAIFYVGMEGYLDLRRAPAGAYEVRANASRWMWQFTYPNGHVDSELLVPVNQPVKVIMDSSDVLHALFIPAFRVKQDIVPGRYSFLWFQATQRGTYELYCAEYCGKDHSQMVSRVIALPSRHDPGFAGVPDAETFEAELEKRASVYETMGPTQLAEYALDRLYPRCSSCHTLDGRTSTGPSWRETHELFTEGGQRVFADGSQAAVDENYIRESILIPSRHIVANFNNAMPAFQGKLKEQQVWALILAIKHLDKFDDQGKLTENIDAEATGGAGTPPSGTNNAQETGGAKVPQ